MAVDTPSRCLLLLSISGLATAGFFWVPRFGGSLMGRLALPKFEFKPVFQLKPINWDNFKINLDRIKRPEIPHIKLNPISKIEGLNAFKLLPKDEGINRLNPLTKIEGTKKLNPIPPTDEELHSFLDEVGKTKEEDKLLQPGDDEDVRHTNEEGMKNKKTGKSHTHIHVPHPHHEHPHHEHPHHEHPHHELHHATPGGDFRERMCDDNDTSTSPAGPTTHVTNGASKNTSGMVTATYEPQSGENGSGNSTAEHPFINTANRRAKIWTIISISLGATLILAVGVYLYKNREKTRRMDDEFALLQ